MALVLVGAAGALRVFLQPLIGDAGTFLPFVLAVALSAFLGGRGPALAAVLASLLAVALFLLPATRVTGQTAAWLGYMGLFTGVAVLVAETIHRFRRSEQALRAEETRFQHLADNAPILIWRADSENRRTWFNRPWLEFTGRSMEEALGHGWEDALHPQDRDGALALCQTHLERREPFQMECRMRRHDGTYRWVLDRGAPVFEGPEGGFSGYIGSCVDITDHHESEARLRAILDHASAVVFLKDREGRYLWVNEEFLRIFGLEREAVNGLREVDLFPGELTTPMREHDRTVWQTQIPLTAEEVVPQAGGARSYIATKFLLRDAGGQPYALCGIATDITSRKEIEQTLQAADRRKDVFLATLAHELRNPLAPIRQAVKLLERAELSPQDAIRAREIIDRQSRNMARLLDDLLDVSRITRGALSLRKERVEVARAIDAASEIARPLLDERRHQLHVHLPAQALYVEADPLRLAQVLANLLTNAAKYTNPGGQISVTVELSGADVVVRVQDNGIGIPPEMLPHVFEMFTQGTSRSAHTAGLGIGLALVRGLLNLHGGTIEANSAGAGCGSEFIVKMPVESHSATVDVSERAREPSLPPATRRRCRVLVADDNRDAAVSLEILLDGDGYEVRTVHDGRAALEAAEAFRPHVAILDIGMPELNGLQVAERIRAQAWGREVHLIALTGWGQAEDRRRALEAGFDQHVTKPLEPDQLESLFSKVDGLT